MSKKKERIPVVLEQIPILDFAAEAKCISKVNDIVEKKTTKVINSAINLCENLFFI